MWLVVSNRSQGKRPLNCFSAFSFEHLWDGEKIFLLEIMRGFAKKYPQGSHLWPLLSSAAKKYEKREKKLFWYFFICLLNEWSFGKKKKHFIKFHLNSELAFRVTIPKVQRFGGREKVFFCFKCQRKGFKTIQIQYEF